MEPLRLYLSGPMSGYENLNRNAFENVKSKLTSCNHKVTTPFDIMDVDPSDEYFYEECLRQDILFICSAYLDFLMVLPGWENSKGCLLEVHTARTIGLDVVDTDFRMLEPKLRTIVI